jgi:hypothetical protein
MRIMGVMIVGHEGLDSTGALPQFKHFAANRS